MTATPRRRHIDRRRLLMALGADRGGVFTAQGARLAGVSSGLVAYHLRTGFLERVAREVYRIADAASHPNEDLVVACAAYGREAVVSHESALKLYDLADVAPSTTHVTVPRSRRYLSDRGAAATMHTAGRPFAPDEIVQHEGFRATSPVRSIVDCAKAHTAPDQVAMAVRTGLERGLFAVERLEAALAGVPARTRRLVLDAVPRASA